MAIGVNKGIERFQASGGSLKTGTDKYSAAPIATTDNTATIIVAIPVAELEAIGAVVQITGKQDDGTDANFTVCEFSASRATSGNVTIRGSSAIRVIESNASTNVTVTANTTDQTVEVKVVGISAENWTWEAHVAQLTRI